MNESIIEKLPRRVVCAAIRHEGHIIAGVRHFDMIMHGQIERAYKKRPHGQLWEQGFLDAAGNFLTRIEALEAARHNNQILDESNVRGGILYSEDVW